MVSGHFEAARLGELSAAAACLVVDGGDQWRKGGGGVCQFFIFLSWLMAGLNAETELEGLN